MLLVLCFMSLRHTVHVVVSVQWFGFFFFFAVGGTFLVSGSTDHYIRIYQMTPGPPEKIAELDLHNVSLILYLAFLLWSLETSSGLIKFWSLNIPVSSLGSCGQYSI